VTRAIVYHSSYGCDTGCCGHFVELDDGRGLFDFDHPYGEDVQEFVRRLVTDAFGEEHVADIAWDECVVSDD